MPVSAKRTFAVRIAIRAFHAIDRAANEKVFFGTSICKNRASQAPSGLPPHIGKLHMHMRFLRFTAAHELATIASTDRILFGRCGALKEHE